MPINKCFLGSTLYQCPVCGKEIWLTKAILVKAYGGGGEPCLDCRSGNTFRKSLIANSISKGFEIVGKLETLNGDVYVYMERGFTMILPDHFIEVYGNDGWSHLDYEDLFEYHTGTLVRAKSI